MHNYALNVFYNIKVRLEFILQNVLHLKQDHNPLHRAWLLCISIYNILKTILKVVESLFIWHEPLEFPHVLNKLFIYVKRDAFIVFLAHLSYWLMVSYCDLWMSVCRQQ